MLEAVKNELEKYDGMNWRMQRYFNEECDDVCKYYKPVFDHLYARYSKKKVLPGQKKFMCLDELVEIASISNLLGENSGERDIYQAYNLAMMT